MIDPYHSPLAGDTPGELVRSCNQIVPKLPPDIRKRFNAIHSEYIGALGFERASERLRGRSVAQVIAEYVPTGVKPVESGEIDGVSFKLYDPPGDDQ